MTISTPWLPDDSLPQQSIWDAGNSVWDTGESLWDGNLLVWTPDAPPVTAWPIGGTP